MEEASENEQLLSGQEDVEEEEPDVNFSSETQQKELIDENSIPQHLDVSPVSADNSDQVDRILISNSQHCGRSLRRFHNHTSAFVKAVKGSWLFVEMLALLKLALPIFLTYFFQQLLYLVVSLFVGHFSDKSTFDAAALGNSFVNVTGLSIIIGLSTAAGTLCPQSYGFKNYKRVGIIVQRGILILSLACLPIIVIWLNSESVLLLLQQQPCVARVSGQYLRVNILALPGMVLATMLQKYLQAQSVVWVFVGSAIISSTVGILLCAIFVVSAKLGAIGASLTLVIANCLYPLLLIGYIWLRGLHKQTWGGWSWQSLDEWGQFLKLGVPGILMLCFEWWTYEISVLVTGSIDQTQLAVNTILVQLLAFAFMVPLGLSIAANIRVGNELGAGSPLRAKRASYAAFIIAVATALSLTALLLATKDYIGKAFITDEDVVHETSRAIYVSLGGLFGDQIQGTISGVLRGTGRQALAAVVNFTVYYLIGLPMGISLALLTNMGTLGMWIGLSTASLLQAIIFTIVLFTTNWKKQSEKAKKNASDSNKLQEKEEQRHNDEITEQDEMQVEGKDDVISKPTATDGDDGIAHSLAADILKENLKDEGECNGELDIEEVPLVSHQDVEEDFTIMGSPSMKQDNIRRIRLRLLLTKGTVFAVGFLVLIIGALLAGLFPHGGRFESVCIVNNTCYCNSSDAYELEATTSVLSSSVSATVDYSMFIRTNVLNLDQLNTSTSVVCDSLSKSIV